MKGDVAGICAPGQSSEGMEKRIDKFGLRDRFVYQGYPTTFWDAYQEAATPSGPPSATWDRSFSAGFWA